LSRPALICDTGALVDYLVAAAPDHYAFRAAIDAARTRYIPGLVLAELDYFLRNQRRAMGSLIDDIRRGAFVYAPPTDAQLNRAMAIDAAYANLSLGLVDATIVALAEELDLPRLQLATSETSPPCGLVTAGPLILSSFLEPQRSHGPRVENADATQIRATEAPHLRRLKSCAYNFALAPDRARCHRKLCVDARCAGTTGAVRYRSRRL